MKRKFLIYGIVAIFLLLSSVLGYQFIKTYQARENVLQRMEKLPEFTLQGTDGISVTNKNLGTKNTTVFIFFNSECHYCQEEAQQLTAAKDQIQNIKFLWISSESMATIKAFQNQYQLANDPNCTFLQDTNSILATSLSISSTPQFLVYGTENKLIKNHKGAWRIDKLLEYILDGQKAN